jgi:hypothetical protein
MYNVCSITATCGRNHCLSRAIRFFINQDYTGQHTMLIFNNSNIQTDLKLDLEPLPENKRIIVINQFISSETGQNYNNLGQIYRDALKHVPVECDVITHQDDDDTFLPNHISEGVKGLGRAIEQGMIAYKPSHSYLRDTELKVSKVQNTLEPSIFVLREHIEKYKYSDKTTEQHLTWVEPLTDQKKILVDPNGVPTLIYDWSGSLDVFKTSGDYTNPQNFNNYRKNSTRFSSSVKPATESEISKFYIDA